MCWCIAGGAVSTIERDDVCPSVCSVQSLSPALAPLLPCKNPNWNGANHAQPRRPLLDREMCGIEPNKTSNFHGDPHPYLNYEHLLHNSLSTKLTSCKPINSATSNKVWIDQKPPQIFMTYNILASERIYIQNMTITKYVNKKNDFHIQQMPPIPCMHADVKDARKNAKVKTKTRVYGKSRVSRSIGFDLERIVRKSECKCVASKGGTMLK